MSLMRKENVKKYTLNDLNINDIQLLSLAASLPPKTWMCFGMSYYKLSDLNLIDRDNSVTFYGKELIKSLRQ